MAVVVFSGGLVGMTDGETRVEIEASRVSALVRALGERFPALRGQLDNMAVAIDGEIHQDASFLRLRPDSEVHFLPRVAGG